MIRTKKIVLFLFSLLVFNSPTHTQMTTAPMPQSEQDMNKMVQELEKATKEIDTFVKALPPAEQAEFNRIVEQVESKMSQTDPAVLERFLTNQMNPEELDQFLGNVFEGITPPEVKPEETVVKPQPTPKKEVKPTPKEVSKLDRALDTLNTIIKRTDSFVVKAQEMPELAGKVKRWGKRGILYDWEPSFEWDKVKKDIESLRQLIQKLIEKDPKDSTYKYLNDFIAQETLVNNVEKLKTTLVEYEPTIETSVFGIEKMDATAKKALKRTISGYTEALYRLKITEDLNKIFEKYEPRAKELREEKETAEKAAEGAGQRSRFSARKEMVLAGREDTGGDYSSSSPDYSNYDNYYRGGSSYEPSSYDYSRPSYSSDSSKTGGDAGGAESGKSGSDAGAGKDKKPSGNGSEEPAKEEVTKGSNKGSSSKTDKKPAPKKEAESVEKSLKEITESVNIVGYTIIIDDTLKDIKKHITDDKESDTDTIKTEVYKIREQIKYLTDAKNDIDDLKKELEKKNGMQALSRVQKRLEEDVIKKHEPAFKKFIEQVNAIEALDPLEKNDIIKEKRIAYLGEPQVIAPVKPKPTKGAKKEVQTEQPKIIETVDLFELPKAWQAVQKAIKDFSKKPEPVVIPTPVKPAAPVKKK